MHGYSGTPLPQKLGLKPGLTVYVDGGPDHVDELLAGVDVHDPAAEQIDVTLLFTTTYAGWRSGCRWCSGAPSSTG